MIIKNLMFVFFLFLIFCLVKIFNYKPETIEATVIVDVMVNSEEIEHFLRAMSSVGKQFELVASETISQNPNGADVVTFQLKKGDEIVVVALNSLLNDKFSILFYSDESESAVILKAFENEWRGRWHLE